MAAELKPIDVICQPSRDGKITPMKIRVIDEDGEYQESIRKVPSREPQK